MLAMYHYQFSKTQDSISNELESLGLKDIYELDDCDSNQQLIGGFSPIKLKIDHLKDHKCLISEKADINWGDQWALNNDDYIDGECIISRDGYSFPLLPGPGFGDYSHPTTQLMLDLMPNQVKNKTVIDIGCGSGILSIAAYYLGAKDVYAVDIDSNALEHTLNNLQHNKIENITVSDTLPPLEAKNDLVILMNMISQDQDSVFEVNPHLLEIEATWVISGLLEGQTPQIIGSVLSQATKGEWLAYLIEKKSQ